MLNSAPNTFPSLFYLFIREFDHCGVGKTFTKCTSSVADVACTLHMRESKLTILTRMKHQNSALTWGVY
jgi:hypothetical protein